MAPQGRAWACQRVPLGWISQEKHWQPVAQRALRLPLPVASWALQYLQPDIRSRECSGKGYHSQQCLMPALSILLLGLSCLPYCFGNLTTSTGA